MKTISRRSFIKTSLVGAAMLAVGRANLQISRYKEKVVLWVDEDGNAFLQGVELSMDVQGNAKMNVDKEETL